MIRPSVYQVLRSRPAILLLVATFVLTLALSATFIALHRFRDMRGAAFDPPAVPMTDEQSKQQVIGASRELIAAGHLKNSRGSYLLMSCTDGDAPPYQGAVRLNFDIPGLKDTPRYFGDIAGALIARGWTDQNPAGLERGRPTFTKDGVTVIYYADPDVHGRATMQIYGECRNTTDHRADAAGWGDITTQLVS